MFLDLKADKYLVLSHAVGVQLNHIVSGWSFTHSPNIGSMQNRKEGLKERSENVVRVLLEKRILTDSALEGKPASPVELILPKKEIIDEYACSSPVLTFTHVRNFLVAWISAKLKLHSKSIESIVTSVQYRKGSCAGIALGCVDTSRLRELVTVFETLRPIFYTANSACLFDSLLLLEFLYRYGFFPTWVFAVQMEPFSAHCWVQQDEFVLNDRTINTNLFTPIMAI